MKEKMGLRVIIIGPRECGKTTFAQSLIANVDPTAVMYDWPQTPQGESWIYMAQTKHKVPLAVKNAADVVYTYVKGSNREFRESTL